MAGNDQNKNRARIANEVAEAVLKDLGAVDASTEAGRAINQAREFSAQMHETFDRRRTAMAFQALRQMRTVFDPMPVGIDDGMVETRAKGLRIHVAVAHLMDSLSKNNAGRSCRPPAPILASENPSRQSHRTRFPDFGAIL